MKEDFKHKLFHFEAEPPAQVWNKIAENLDGETNGDFAERLFDFEAAPPAGVWNKIDSQLNNDIEAPVVPITNRSLKIFHYGTAAAILIGVAFSVNLFLNKNTSVKPSNSIITNQSTIVPVPLINEQARDTESSSLLSDEDATTKNTTTYKRRTLAKYRVQTLRAQNKIQLLGQTAALVMPKGLPLVQSDVPDRYIIFSTATGEVVRLSKKLFSLFACSDQFQDCRQNIEFVRQQMASPTIMASTDFNGVLDLLHNMNTQ